MNNLSEFCITRGKMKKETGNQYDSNYDIFINGLQVYK